MIFGDPWTPPALVAHPRRMTLLLRRLAATTLAGLALAAPLSVITSTAAHADADPSVCPVKRTAYLNALDAFGAAAGPNYEATQRYYNLLENVNTVDPDFVRARDDARVAAKAAFDAFDAYRPTATLALTAYQNANNGNRAARRAAYLDTRAQLDSLYTAYQAANTAYIAADQKLYNSVSPELRRLLAEASVTYEQTLAAQREAGKALVIAKNEYFTCLAAG